MNRRFKLALLLVAVVVFALALSARATVPSASSSAGPYTCNGTTTVFAVPFKFLANGDLLVRRTHVVSGTIQTLALTTDYTVAGAGAAAGGSVTLVAGSRCASGFILTIRRSTSRTQPANLRASSQYSAPAVELGLDRQGMIAQELGRDQDEAVAAATTAIAQAAAASSSAASAWAAVAAAAVPGSATPTTASGSTTPRTLADRFGQVINLKDGVPGHGGCAGDGVTDDTACIQAAFDALEFGAWNGARAKIVVPRGRYIVRAPGIRVEAKQGFTVEGEAGSVFVWDSDAATSSVFTTHGCADVVWKGFHVTTSSAGKSALAAFLLRPPYVGRQHFDGIVITGSYNNLVPYQIEYGVYMKTEAGDPDSNNDHHYFEHMLIQTTRVGVRIGHTQSKAHKFIGNFIVARDYGVESSGSFFWYGGAMAGHEKCDFVQDTVVNSDPILISGMNSETSRRLFCFGGEGFPVDGLTAQNALPTNANQMPITIEGVRFDTNMMEPDGIESTDGTNIITKASPTAEDLDGNHGNVGWSAVVHVRFAGPLNIIGCRFGTTANQAGAHRPRILHFGGGGSSTTLLGNVFITDDWRVSPLVGDFSGARLSQGNLAYMATSHAGTPAYTAVTQHFAGEMPPYGRSFFADTEWDGWYGTTYPLKMIKEHHRILLNNNITTFTAPDGRPGQDMTLEFVGNATYRYAVSGWGSNFQLAAPFDHPINPSEHSSITFRWDPILAKWVETARSVNASKLTRGSSTAAPSTGWHAQGEFYWNSAPAAGSPFGWRNLADGNPGTWEPMYAHTAAP